MLFSRFFIVLGLTILMSSADAQAQAVSPGGSKILFDGTSLDAWRGFEAETIGQGWKIVDGALLYDGSGGGDIVTKEEFGDFELTFEWRVPSGANSGVMYRVGLGEEAPYLTGPEYQILDDAGHGDGKNPLTSAGSLYGLYAPQNKTLNPLCYWNSAKIVAHGNRIEHWLNGAKVLEAEIGSDDWNERLNKSKFKAWPTFASLPSGRICLQDHGNEVWYRDIRIWVTGNQPSNSGPK